MSRVSDKSNSDWYVIYCRPRTEKKTALSLEKMGIEVYCPIKKTRRKWSDRWKWVEMPLFTSYIFIRIEESKREEVFIIPSVVRFLYYLGVPAKVRDKDLDELRKWMGEFEHDRISLSFIPEDQVRVKSGPLMDSTGIVVQQKGQILTLVLEGLGVKVRLDLRENAIEKLQSSQKESR
jgi:transcription antitermination factor NusG